MTQTSSLSEKVERAAKIIGTFIAVCTAVIGVSSWLFNSAMSSRDRHIERLSTELREMKEGLKDASSSTNRKLDSLSEDIIRLKIAIIASKAEVDLRSAQTVSPMGVRPRSRARGAGDSSLEVGNIDHLLDSVMPVAMVTDTSDTQHHETIVDVNGSSVVIDDPETARTLYTNAISQIETEPPGVSDAHLEAASADNQEQRVLATTDNTE